jgi:uncharacterized protein YidB (DUF937 family)
MLDDVLNKAVPGGSIGKPLVIAMGALLASGALHRQLAGAGAPAPAGAGDGGLLAGLGGLLSRFQQNGQADIINSWIGSGPNQTITPGQLGTVLGPDILKTLSEKSGIPQQDLMAQLSNILPGVIDRLTPNGRLPSAPEASR